jgi:hypothetical protein
MIRKLAQFEKKTAQEYKKSSDTLLKEIEAKLISIKEGLKREISNEKMFEFASVFNASKGK